MIKEEKEIEKINEKVDIRKDEKGGNEEKIEKEKK